MLLLFSKSTLIKEVSSFLIVNLSYYFYFNMINLNTNQVSYFMNNSVYCTILLLIGITK